MKIGELAGCLPDAELLGDPEVKVSGIAYDSRQVESGDLFVCIKGLRFDGHSFIDDALRLGAVGLVVDAGSEVAGSVPAIRTGDTRKALGLLSAHFYDYPSRKLRLIGITGTKGKTTTTYLIKSVLEAAGHRVGLVGTIQNMIGDVALPAKRTTPESVDLQSLLSEMVTRGCDFAVMEVSSHAIKLKRIAGSEFDIGVFTNLSQDHLDFHPSLQDYVDTKASFFEGLGIGVAEEEKAAIVNYDERYSDYVKERTSVPVITYGTVEGAMYRARDIAIRPDGLSYTLEYAKGQVMVELPITGQFNVYNSLAALAACLTAGIPLPMVVKGLREASPVPGRLEPVEKGQDFTVLVDYAHSPASLENVLKTVKGLTRGRTILVFGCGGDRDKGKRPLMGRIAGDLADVVIVTTDNPRNESAEAICEAIGAGVRETIGSKPWEVIVDRQQAIFRAIGMASPEDTVLISGKGHETYQIFEDRTIHFDDREEAAEALKERLGLR